MSNITDFARDVLRQEAVGIENLVGLIDESFEAAVNLILACGGHV